MAEETIAVLGVLVALFLVLDVFLYYRWKSLKEDAEEKQSSKRIAHVKEHVSKFAAHEGGSYAGEPAVVLHEGQYASSGGLAKAKHKPRDPAFEKAFDSMDELRSLSARELGFLRDRLDSTHKSLSGEPTQVTLAPSAEGEGDSTSLGHSGGVKVFFSEDSGI